MCSEVRDNGDRAAIHGLRRRHQQAQAGKVRRIQPHARSRERRPVGHGESDERLLSPFKPAHKAVDMPDADETERLICPRRAVLGGWDGLLRRRRAEGHRHRRAQEVHEPRRVHRHPAGQEILQPPDGRLRRTGKQLEREREDSGRHLRGRGSKSQHHLRCGCGSKVQRGRRGDDLRRDDASGEQQDRHYTGD